MKSYKVWLAVIALCAPVVGCGDDGTDNGGGAGSAGLPGMAGGGAGMTGSAGTTAGTTGGVAGMAGRAGGGAGAGAGMGAAGMATAGTTGAGAGGASGGAGGASGGAGGATGGAGGAGGSGGGAFTLTSTAFMNDGMLPMKHRCVALGGETGPSPALMWTGAPAGTMSFAITMTDTTAGLSMNYAHWTMFDIPAATTMLPEGVPEGAMPAMPAGAKQVPNQNLFVGGPGYFGPCGSGGEFTYEIKVYALMVATLPGVGVDSTAMQVRTAIEANDIASATLKLRSSE